MAAACSSSAVLSRLSNASAGLTSTVWSTGAPALDLHPVGRSHAKPVEGVQALCHQAFQSQAEHGLVKQGLDTADESADGQDGIGPRPEQIGPAQSHRPPWASMRPSANPPAPGDPLTMIGTLLNRLILRNPFHQPRAHVIFVPMIDDLLHRNPADRRRIEIPAAMATEVGYRTSIMRFSAALETDSDVVYLQTRDFDALSRNMDQLKRGGRKVIYSFSDALFCSPSSRCHYEDRFHDRAVPAPPINDQVRDCFSAFDLIIAGSEEQMAQMIQLGLMRADKCVCLLDPIDEAAYRPNDSARASIAGDRLRIVWEGFIDNVPSLSVAAEGLARVAREIPIELCVLTSAKRRNVFLGTDDNAVLAKTLLPGVPLRFVEWSADASSAEMSRAHIGINPVLDDPFNWAKPANKSVILNYFGLPVVASTNKANKTWIVPGMNGFVAANADEWEWALRAFSDESIAKMSAHARRAARRVQRDYPSTLDTIFKRVLHS